MDPVTPELTRVRRVPDDKVAALRVLTEHVVPGRWAEVRWPTPSELRATTVLRVPLDTAVAKVRDGGVSDEPSDLDLPVWAGIVPLLTALGDPEPDAALDPALAASIPTVATDGRRRRGAPAIR